MDGMIISRRARQIHVCMLLCCTCTYIIIYIMIYNIYIYIEYTQCHIIHVISCYVLKIAVSCLRNPTINCLMRSRFHLGGSWTVKQRHPMLGGSVWPIPIHSESESLNMGYIYIYMIIYVYIYICAMLIYVNKIC